MTPFVSPKQDDVMEALRQVLAAATPLPLTAIVLGQVNRVPEPGPAANYAVMTPLRRRRISTNVDGFDDCKFVGSVAGTTLTVTETPDVGLVTPNREMFGANVVAGTTILRQLTQTHGDAPGGRGTYLLDRAQTITEQVFASGATDVAAPYMLDVQLDFHGQGSSGDPGDYAQAAATLLRDAWAVSRFSAQPAPAGGGAVTPLYADDPKQVPFINGENQYEDRWVVEATLQVNEHIAVPQEYMDEAVAGLIEVDTFYPGT